MKGQLFSVDLLLAIALLTVVLGLWLNSLSAVQKASYEFNGNATAVSITSEYFERVSSSLPLPGNCAQNGAVITCDACAPPGRSEVVSQRIAVRSNAPVLLRVAVCA